MKSLGFTLIEVLLAMVIFTLIIAVTYGALGPAGEGFIQLKEHRDHLEKQHWASWQLRQDITYMTTSHDTKLKPLRITHDSRGDAVFDELWLLIGEMGQSSLSMVHYFIDEESGVLVRESRMAWARTGREESLRWELGDVLSFDVEVMNKNGRWLQNWDQGKIFLWPKAIRIKIRDKKGEQQWNYPMMLGQP